jgi:hypothetical protein
MMRRRSTLVVATAASISLGVACYGPTEVRVELSTDLPCRAATDGGGTAAGPVHTFVRLGGAVDAPVVADTSSCTPRAGGDFVADIGSIVLVPSGDRSAHVTVQVTATADGSDPDVCGRPGTPVAAQAQCIVARRTFVFIKHTSRSLPIRLYASCKGQVCDATQTCNQSGACESAVVSDDTGCLASEPTCNDAVVAPPPTDAGEGGDATPTADAADAEPVRLPCTAADGTNVLAIGTPTDLVAINSSKIFFVGAGPAVSSAAVYAIDKNNPGPPVFLFAIPVGLGTARALAADDAAVWGASADMVYRHDLGTGNRQSYKVASPQWLATATLLRPSGITAPDVFAITADVSAQEPPFGSRVRLEADGTIETALVDQPGTRIATSGAPTSTVFVFNSTAYGGPSLYRTSFTDGTTDPIKVNEPFGGMTADATTLFFAADKNVQRVDASSTTPTSLYDVTVPGAVAVDTANLYFEQGGPDGAIFRGGRGGNSDAPLLPASRVATGYTDVRGLVIDAQCVYFWSTPGISALATLNVYPKTRTVPGTPATVHTP